MLAIAGIPACARPLQVPYLEPKLHGWRAAPAPQVEVHVFRLGRARLPRALLYRRAGLGLEELAITAVAVTVGGKPRVVFDTGVKPAEDGLAGLVQPAIVVERRSFLDALARAGLDARAVEFVVLSDLHFDHTGAASEFPRARVVVTRSEHARWLERPPALFSNWSDLDAVGSRWLVIDPKSEGPYATFTGHYDLLGDGSVQVVALPGHRRGNIGLLVHSAGGPILVTGHAAWTDAAWRYAVMPPFAEDPAEWWETVWRIKLLARLVPELTVVSAGDLDAVRRTRAIVVHDAPQAKS